jgi:tetratricopeptide (TPR) repeat protein
MSLPGSLPPIASRRRFAPRTTIKTINLLCLGAALCGVFCGVTRLVAQQQIAVTAERLRLHDSTQWRDVQEHLPDPRTATPQALEQQADILRARRFPEDAMDFYNYALARGASVPPVLNKLGLAELEMKNVELARAYFKRSVKMDAKSADAWNNLGAVEYLDRGPSTAIGDYKRAIKLDKHQAVFHANLATVYFEVQNYGGARREMATALTLDPDIFDSKLSPGGVQAHILTSQDRARFAFEMARMYARSHLDEQMLHSLAMACESGMDVQREMRKDQVMAQFENDPRVVVLVHNAQVIRSQRASTVSASGSGNPGQEPAAAKPVSE